MRTERSTKSVTTEIPEITNESVVIKTTYPPGRILNVYIMSEIGEPSEYIEFIDTLAGAKEGDEVNLYINTPGGDLDTTIMIVNAISATAAIIRAYLTGTVASGGTAIALACDDVIPMAYSEFMIHTYSMGTYGKGHEIDTRVKFTGDRWKQFAKDVYTPFLTDEELDAVLRGEDKYFSASDVVERWETVLEFREEQLNKHKADNLQQDTDTIISYLESKGYTVTQPDATPKKPKKPKAT